MEVIAGKYRGRKLISESPDTRPTLARVKSSIFSMIDGYVRGYRVLDLFAGSGAMGIECISRGAYETVLNDCNTLSVNSINKNLRNVTEKYRVTKNDFLDALEIYKREDLVFDLIFIDPPYKSDYGIESIKRIEKNKLLSENGIIVFEHDTGKEFDLPKGYKQIKSRKYGDKTVSIIENAQAD